MAEEVLLAKKNGSISNGTAKSSFGQGNRQTQPGLELRFRNLQFKIKDKQILYDVSGTGHPGKVLAIMGPSGSGKTTLLNVLGGRIKCSRCQATIGGQPLTKRTRRNISYVLQQDIFFPNLTLQQTLMFAAQLRLPESLTTHDKKEIVEGLIDQLDMRKCTKTIIGDNMNRGLSGGEKKRANIANELLTDPAVLLLDEPTSGLDSSTAFALTLSLKKYAVQSGKTVMMTIHQPSAQMFFQFDTVLLLSGGKVAYYGAPNDVLKDFSDMGYACDTTHYNPADFILDVVKSGNESADRLISASNRRRLNTPDCPILKSTVSAHELHHESEGDNFTNFNNETAVEISNGKLHEPELTGRYKSKEDIENSDSSIDRFSDEDDTDSRWNTSFFTQFKVLTQRSFIQGKYRFLSTLKFVKTIGVALICGLLWFEIGRGRVREVEVQDITACLFFVTLFNSFNSLFDILMVFPSEREVINKERMSGSYRLSAYYLAKSVSELPLGIILPSISTFIIYWMAGLNGFQEAWAFFGTWFVMILMTVGMQSLGMFIGTATMDFDHALVLAIFIMITFMLLGGFYIKNIPTWLHWLRYVSPFQYSWSLMLYMEFDSNERVLCSPENSMFPSCVVNGTMPGNETRFVEFKDILNANGADVPAWACVLSLIGTLVVFRVIGYILLRMFHKPMVK
uniref:ABC transporter G family member 14-like isoform X1 n=1 Tax=Ciona intestinalis TaxID=7719 RepID=UPI000180C94B|nr:ABC transporter G family member 14-like isoform X1 [Ciona intestinalis]|eukprot:XP_002120877.1 ABC transporter G family member 14-like isoform X1 [Ciona intestinalis]